MNSADRPGATTDALTQPSAADTHLARRILERLGMPPSIYDIRCWIVADEIRNARKEKHAISG